MTPADRLVIIKSAHTVIWAFFAGCILAIPLAVFAGHRTLALLLIAIVSVEVVIILLNRWRCPLTNVAARYTSDRRDNFDIYLPEWLARYNRAIFGTLFAAGVIYTALRFLAQLGTGAGLLLGLVLSGSSMGDEGSVVLTWTALGAAAGAVNGVSTWLMARQD